MNILKSKRFYGAILAIAGVVFFTLDGCEGTDLDINLPQSTDSLESHISTLQLEIDDRGNKIESLINKADDASKELFECNEAHKNCTSDLSTITITEVIKVDTCFKSLELDEDVRKTISSLEEYIRALGEEARSLKTQLKSANLQIANLQLSDSIFLTTSGLSPYFAEKATIQKDIDGTYKIQFQEIQTFGSEIDEIIRDAFDTEPSTAYYPFSVTGGWGLLNDLGDSTSYQGYSFGAMWRPAFLRGRIGIGLEGFYASRNVNKYAPTTDRFGLEAKMEYTFRVKK